MNKILISDFQNYGDLKYFTNLVKKNELLIDLVVDKKNIIASGKLIYMFEFQQVLLKNKIRFVGI